MNKLLPKTQFNPQGFTLIELMIAIAIVAILATIGFTVYSNTQMNARDAKRRQDIDAIAAALESKRVPSSTRYSVLAATDFSGGAVPTDPKSAAGSTGQRSYCIIPYATVPPATISPLVWGNFSDRATCSTAGASTAISPAPAAGSVAVLGVGSPVLGSTTSWAVCAFLEQGEAAGPPSTGTIYCKLSN